MTDDFRTQLASKTDDELLEMLRDRESGEWQPEALVAAAAILTDRGIALPEAEDARDGRGRRSSTSSPSRDS